MSWIHSIEKLDRRWIFVTIALLVLFPLLFPLALPLTVSPPVQGFYDAVAKVPNGSTVLMSCDYDPGAKPELVPMTRTALRHLWDKDCKIVVTVLWDGARAWWTTSYARSPRSTRARRPTASTKSTWATRRAARTSWS